MGGGTADDEVKSHHVPPSCSDACVWRGTEYTAEKESDPDCHQFENQWKAHLFVQNVILRSYVSSTRSCFTDSDTSEKLLSFPGITLHINTG